MVKNIFEVLNSLLAYCSRRKRVKIFIIYNELFELAFVYAVRAAHWAISFALEQTGLF